MKPIGLVTTILTAGYVTTCSALTPAAPARPSASATKPKAPRPSKLTTRTPPSTRKPPLRTSPAVSFSRDIRPILSENCFACHGPDESNLKGGLRLDRREDLFTRRGPHAPVVAGKPEASRIWVRIAATNPQHRMPPPSSHKQLKPEQKELIRRWILQGAPYEAHWAFVAPQMPQLPKVRNEKWVRNPIDRFVLARLEREGLAPSPEADPVTLLRRLSLDLIGLPPTPEEIDQFLRDCEPRVETHTGNLARLADPSPPTRTPNFSSKTRNLDRAYARQVERLLASPHYGERWGRIWLDAARYADSDGFEKDKPRFVWFYRDWVINALNRDLPYDRFIIEQIAGDLLPNPTQDQLVATGFLRNSMINEEGGVDPEQFRMEAMFDRMDALGKSVLGLTIQCAQCHTHKYDPLTQAEYYRMFAFLNNSHEANAAVYTPEGLRKRAEIIRQTQEIEGRLRHEHPDWPKRMAAWEQGVRNDQPEWRIVRPELDASGGQKHTLLEDGSILAQGYSPARHTTEFSVTTDGRPVTAVRLELLNDPNLPQNGPGRAVDGLCALTELRVIAAPADQPGKRQNVKIASATADVNPGERELAPLYDDRSKRRRVTGPVAFAHDGKDETAWGLDVGPGRSNVPRKAVFVFEKPVSFPKGTALTFYLDQKHGGWNNNDNQSSNLGRFRFSVTDAPQPKADPVPTPVREILALPAEKRSPAQTAAIFSYWRTTVPEWREANASIERLWQDHPRPHTQLVLRERAETRTTHLLERGDFLKPAKAVDPGVPSFLHPLRTGGDRKPNRLDFAKWLVDPRSPTTGRSLVNRVWQTYFGTGLVATSEDLGLQSEIPSHPELLDFLASSFVAGARGQGLGVREPGGQDGTGLADRSGARVKGAGERGIRSTAPASGSRGSGYALRNTHYASTSPLAPQPSDLSQGLGYSLKQLHRLIVTSATYRQSSKVTPERYARDPNNRLLARGSRFRVDAEIVHDVALAAAGLLNPKLGGPSVYPPAPEFLFVPPASYGPKVWREEKGPDRYRRALYTFRYRSVPYPMLLTFDAPNGDASCVRRVRSNTPLQALTTLNEPLFMEAAQALGLKTLREGGATDAERLAFAFRRCVSRKPNPREMEVLLALLAEQKDRYARGEAEAQALVAAIPRSVPAPPQNLPAAEVAAWTAVSRVLLNLDETITRE